MRKNGFTLIELIVVVAIAGALLAIGTLAFNSMTRKSAIEAQTKEIYGDLMKAKSEALYQKVNRSVKVTASLFAIYSTADGTGTPFLQKSFKQAMTQNPAGTVLAFASNGVASGTMVYCIGPLGNPAAIDSVIVDQTIILTGKWTGGACSSANITAK
jgi:prepilin-type N-terminal cleavage/methylation domain-containing protein